VWEHAVFDTLQMAEIGWIFEIMNAAKKLMSKLAAGRRCADQ
jgi:hypothetical protein